MEQLPAQSQNTSLSPVARVSEALQSFGNKFIAGSNDEEIKQALRYGIVLLGIPEEKHGDDLAKAVLLNHLKKAYPTLTINEMKLAFEFAIEGKIDVETILYRGEFISAKFVGGILTAYQNYKKKIQPKKEEVKMNNIQRVTSILSLLPDEFKQSLGSIGKEKESEGERKKLPFHDVHQEWIKRFDKLKLKYEIPKTGGRFIRRYGGAIDLQGYFKKKAEQLQLAKERNQDKL